MGRANLQGLINEVLDMIKKRKGGQDDIFALNSKEERDREDDLIRKGSEESYLKDIRGRNTQLEVGKMHNAGQVDVARENNLGQMARQNLAQSFEGEKDMRGHNLDLYKTRVNEEIGRFDSQTKRIEADSKINQPQKGVLGDQLTAATAILSDMNSSDDDKKMAREFVFGSFKKPETQPVSSALPDGVLSEKKPSEVIRPAVSSRGTNSMEFVSDETLKKRKLAERNKKVEDDMFGKPKRSSFFSW